MRSRRTALLRSIVVLIAVVFFAQGAYLAYAEGEHDHEGSHKKHEETGEVQKHEGVLNVTVEGQNFCLGCALKKGKGAKSQCSIFGHKHSLKVNKAIDEHGNELSEMKGLVLHYLENDNSKGLLGKHHNETVKIKGKVYLDERVLEVESVIEEKNEKEKGHAEGSKLKVQTMCPIMPLKIDTNIFVDYKGTRVYLCCDTCVAMFNKEPEKYIEELKAEGIALANAPKE